MSDSVKSLAAMSEEFVEVTLAHDPVAATEAGIHDYDHRLPDDSPQGFEQRSAWLADFRIRLDAAPDASRVERALLDAQVAAMSIALEAGSRERHDPTRPVWTALTGLHRLVVRAFAPLEERKEAVVARLMAIPDYLDQARAVLDGPPAILGALASEVGRAAPGYVDEVARGLIRSFPGEAERIEHAGGRARMGFLRFQDFLERELRGRDPGPAAIGPEALERRLRDVHLIGLELAAIEALGSDEASRAEARLEEEARRIDPAATWREIVTRARAHQPEPLRLGEAYARTIGQARASTESLRLVPVIAGKLEVMKTPAFERPLAAGVSYLPPAPFDVEPCGVLGVPASGTSAGHDLGSDAHCEAARPLTAAREVYPGRHALHLLAGSAATRLRRLSRDVVLDEGWALYAEELMVEHGGLVDPVTRLFMHRNLLGAACTLLADLGIQGGRLEPQEAVDQLVERAFLERREAETRVANLVRRPLRGASAVLGRHRLLEIRQEARQRAGDRFNLHDFHAALLKAGVIPITLARDEFLASG